MPFAISGCRNVAFTELAVRPLVQHFREAGGSNAGQTCLPVLMP